MLENKLTIIEVLEFLPQGFLGVSVLSLSSGCHHIDLASLGQKEHPMRLALVTDTQCWLSQIFGAFIL